jgi:hypothetical protein
MTALVTTPQLGKARRSFPQVPRNSQPSTCRHDSDEDFCPSTMEPHRRLSQSSLQSTDDTGSSAGVVNVQLRQLAGVFTIRGALRHHRSFALVLTVAEYPHVAILSVPRFRTTSVTASWVSLPHSIRLEKVGRAMRLMAKTRILWPTLTQFGRHVSQANASFGTIPCTAIASTRLGNHSDRRNVMPCRR